MNARLKLFSAMLVLMIMAAGSAQAVTGDDAMINLQNHEDKLQELAENANTAQKKEASLVEKVATLETSMTSSSRKIKEMQKKITSTDSNIVGLSEGITWLQSQIDALALLLGVKTRFLQDQIDTIELTEGPEGPTGPMGPAGTNGADGADGATGPAGTNGADGATGPEGPQGPAGPPGVVTAKTDYYVISGPISAGEWPDYWEGQLLHNNKNINLPHGATVVSFSLEIYDNDAKDASATLGYINDPESFNYWPAEEWGQSTPDVSMASVTSSGASTSWQTLVDSTIDNSVIDNQNNVYNIWVRWPGSDTGFAPFPEVFGAKIVIEYEYTP